MSERDSVSKGEFGFKEVSERDEWLLEWLNII